MTRLKFALLLVEFLEDNGKELNLVVKLMLKVLNLLDVLILLLAQLLNPIHVFLSKDLLIPLLFRDGLLTQLMLKLFHHNVNLGCLDLFHLLL